MIQIQDLVQLIPGGQKAVEAYEKKKHEEAEAERIKLAKERQALLSAHTVDNKKAWDNHASAMALVKKAEADVAAAKELAGKGYYARLSLDARFSQQRDQMNAGLRDRTIPAIIEFRVELAELERAIDKIRLETHKVPIKWDMDSKLCWLQLDNSQSIADRRQAIVDARKEVDLLVFLPMSEADVAKRIDELRSSIPEVAMKKPPVVKGVSRQPITRTVIRAGKEEVEDAGYGGMLYAETDQGFYHVQPGDITPYQKQR